MAIGPWLKRELTRYITTATYLYVCFIAVLLYKAAVLRDLGISYTPYWFAVVKALILAKFMWVGEELHLGDRLTRGTLIHLIVYKAAAFLLLLMALSAAEKWVEGMVHHQSLAQSFADFAGGTVAEILATAFLLFLVLLPYFAYRQLDEALGPGKLLQILRARRVGEPRSGRSA